MKACHEWSSKEDWETQKESSEGRKWRLGLGERQPRGYHPATPGALGQIREQRLEDERLRKIQGPKGQGPKGARHGWEQKDRDRALGQGWGPQDGHRCIRSHRQKDKQT